MAITFSYASIIIPRGQTEKTRSQASLCHSNKVLPKASVSLNKPASPDHTKKIFEDQAMGVICFRDESGEIVCEGFDEGPRFDRQNLAHKHFRTRNRELQIQDMLQRMMIQAIEDDGFYGFTKA